MTRASAAAAPPSTGNRYGQLLQASAWIGGASLATMLIGMLRTKVMALLLGPAGIGLLGLYTSISSLMLTLSGLGTSTSGVRQVAEAAASGARERLALTATVLRRLSLLLALLGAIALAALAGGWSRWTFGNDAHTAAVALLALALFFNVLGEARVALIQGLRQIQALARLRVWGAVWGTAASIPLVYWLRQDGIVPSMIAIALCLALAAWWFSRDLHLPAVRVSAGQAVQHAGALLRLGVVFMLSALLTLCAAYAVRIIVLRELGVEAAGHYHAALALGGLYVSFILQTLSADFYPRLVGAAGDDAHCNRLVNEQATISLLLTGPGVLATVVLAPLALQLFYSADFLAAADALRWICLGMAMRVLNWPLSYILVAKGMRRGFFLTELLWTIANVALSVVCVRRFGLAGSGIAFLLAYLVHAVVIHAVVMRLTGFRWSAHNLATLAVFVGLVALAWLARVLPGIGAHVAGLLILLAGGLYALRRLVRLLPAQRVPRLLRRLFAADGPTGGGA